MLPTSISLCVSINISILSTFCYTHSHTMLQTHGKMSFSFKCMSVELLSFLLLVKTSVATTNLCTTTYTNAVLFYYSLFRKKRTFYGHGYTHVHTTYNKMCLLRLSFFPLFIVQCFVPFSVSFSLLHAYTHIQTFTINVFLGPNEMNINTHTVGTYVRILRHTQLQTKINRCCYFFFLHSLRSYRWRQYV